MRRVEWDAMTDDERDEWAVEWGEGRRCIEFTDGVRCEALAGTPWGVYWCAPHDAERLARIKAGLRSIQADLHAAGEKT